MVSVKDYTFVLCDECQEYTFSTDRKLVWVEQDAFSRRLVRGPVEDRHAPTALVCSLCYRNAGYLYLKKEANRDGKEKTVGSTG